MRHSSARPLASDWASTGRGQVEPLAALAAVFAVCAALTLYAGALDSAMPGKSDRETVTITADRAADQTSKAGIVRPSRLGSATAAAPDGWQLNVTLTSKGEHWQYGPDPPQTAANATRRVSVRHGPGTVRPGRFRVVTWP